MKNNLNHNMYKYVPTVRIYVKKFYIACVFTRLLQLNFENLSVKLIGNFAPRMQKKDQ